jgi:hypothetical protein
MSCKCGKARYKTRMHAIAVAVRRSHMHRPLRVYMCPDADVWHLTSKVTPARRPS